MLFQLLLGSQNSKKSQTDIHDNKPSRPTSINSCFDQNAYNISEVHAVVILKLKVDLSEFNMIKNVSEAKILSLFSSHTFCKKKKKKKIWVNAANSVNEGKKRKKKISKKRDRVFPE